MGIEDCTYSEAIIAIGNTSDVGVYDNIAKPIVEDISDKPCKPDGFVPLSDVLGRPECVLRDWQSSNMRAKGECIDLCMICLGMCLAQIVFGYWLTPIGGKDA